jgi:hypothetical protein
MPSTYSQPPQAGEFSPYYARYLALVPGGDILETLAQQGEETTRLLSGLSAEQAEHRYAPGKWSIKEVLGHIIDGERVFTHRALRFGRGDPTALPSFDENTYVPAGEFGHRPLADLIAEFRATRAATLALLCGLPESAMTRGGEASGAHVTVRGLAWITAGHERHHVKILRERYLA